uniref:ATP-dependent helicase NAM7 n=1 Tax=Philasterides dicentrarchi TaxID=282688 RepID=A0A481XUW5_9CILI|nr:ATP-dependent helicase NAM7 [Philasterides dicentrarchi]
MFVSLREITRTGMQFRLYASPNMPQLLTFKRKYRQWTICKVANMDKYMAQIQGLVTTTCERKMNHMIQKVLLAPPKTMANYVCNYAEQVVEKEVDTEGLKLQMNNYLNKSQYLAIISAVRQLITVIHAPPATGRMKIIVKVVEQWIQINGERILIIVKNEAVLEEIYYILNKIGLHVLRVSMNSVAKFGQQKTTLNNNRVAILTQDSIAQYLTLSRDFQKVLIVDAHDISELTCLSVFNKNCDQVVLIGDHYTYKDKSVEVSNLAKSRGYGVSIFESFIKKGIKPVFVSTMNKENEFIGEYISKCFYGQKLQISQSQHYIDMNEKSYSPFQQKLKSATYANINFQKGILFNKQGMAAVQVNGCELKYGSGLVNIQEIKCLVQFVLFILGHQFVQPQEIGIVTPYLQQSKIIYSELKLQAQNNPEMFQQQHLENNLNIQISTINDSYSSRPFLIFSGVRANKEGYLGQLKDFRIINTLLGKSKKGCVVFGDLPTLAQEKSWMQFISHLQNQNALYQCDYYK